VTGKSSQETKHLKRIPPGLALLLLAPLLGELVSAHQPLLEFCNPLSFLILALPYGFGALICRELVARWGKGRLSLLLLGIAYGIYEEGIVVRSLFDPNWGELGALARYSYFAGVNWTWTAMLIHFHVLISIGASVMLVEILYPEKRHQRWLSNKALIGCFVGLLLWIPLGLWMTSYKPPPGWYSLCWAAIFALAWAAHRLPARPFRPIERAVLHPIFFFLLGLVNMTIFFFTVFLTPEYGAPPLVVTIVWLILLDGLTFWLVLRLSGNGYGWDDRHRLALVAGFLGFFIFFCFAQDFEELQGTSIVGFASVIALWRLGHHVARRSRSQLTQMQATQ
jgi:hypothetical protein